MTKQTTPNPLENFITKVDKACVEQYGLEDGGDLCYNLMEVGRIDMVMGVDHAASIVAQHMLQA